MKDLDKTKEELVKELRELRKEKDELIAMYEKDIDDHKKIGDTLRESESYFQSLFEQAPMGYQSLDEDGCFIEVNQAWLKTLGYTYKEVIGKWFGEFLAPEFVDGFRERFPLFKAKGKIHSEFEMLHKDGSRIVIAFEGRIGYKPDGTFKQTHCMLSDITERKQAEEALRISQQLIEGIINAIPVRVFWKDKNLVYLGCNSIFAHDAGFSDPKDIIGKDDFQMGWRDQAELYRSADIQVIENGCPILLYEEPQTTPEGNTIILLTNKIPLLNYVGEIIGILGTYMDITESKLLEEKIFEKDIQFRKLSANVPDLIFQFTRKPDGTYYVPIASEGIKNIFGCSPEDVADDFAPIASVIYPEDAERVISDIEYSAKNLTYFTCEFRVQIPGKEIQWIYSRSSPEKLADGSITWYGFNADITELKKAEEVLKKKTKQLEELNDVFVDRELRMIEMKKEINELLIKAGSEKRY